MRCCISHSVCMSMQVCVCCHMYYPYSYNSYLKSTSLTLTKRGVRATFVAHCMVENVSEMPLNIYILCGIGRSHLQGGLSPLNILQSYPREKQGEPFTAKGPTHGILLRRHQRGSWEHGRKPSAPELGAGKSTLCRSRDCKESHPTTAGTWHRIDSTMEESGTGESFALKETGQRR